MTSPSILIVEDDGLIALRISELLKKAGYRVPDPIASGEEALALARQSPPDLVLMDIGLAGTLDGIETAELIRKMFDVPVIFLTAHADDGRISRARDISPYGYIVKPFRDQQLLESIEGALVRDHFAKKENGFSPGHS
jgi:CheY-like chemotaxis protein